MAAEQRIDAQDRQLIALLQANARLPVATLARQLGIARSTVQDRLARLERDGVISGYAVRLGVDDEAGRVRAHVLMTVRPKLEAQVVAGLKKLPEVRRLSSVSGAHDLIAEIAASDLPAIDRVLDEIGGMAGIERTTSSIILSTRFSR